MKKLITILLVSILPLTLVVAESLDERQKIANHLQDISVTISAEGRYSKSEGSGVLINRVVDGEKVTFVWTCGHVVDDLRKVRTVIEGGAQVQVVEFPDVQIIKELVEDGRRVGEIKMDATVVKFSDADEGEDLALLMVRARDYGKGSAEFYLDAKKPIVPIGTELFHVGSLLGQMGANSMTSGIVSQVGRTLGKTEFDQTTVTAFPGSSGGGVYLKDGTYMGMIVRGAGEGFNLIVPVRRMIRWAKKHKIMWALDPKVKMPTMEYITNLPIETASIKEEDEKKKNTKTKAQREFDETFPYLIKEISELPTLNKLPAKNLRSLEWTPETDIEIKTLPNAK